MAIRYEWDFEYVDEHGDITDHHHCATFREVKQVEARNKGAGRIVLVRTNDRPYGEREWAYLGDNGKLPSHFNDSGDGRGAHVPLRFHVEVAATPVK
ncbi:MAG: hypothetical protein ACRC2H_01070 [Silanimonas sp.]